MDIKGFIEWVGHSSGSAFATVFPYLLVGIVGLYLLYLVVGYLRATQVGVPAETQPAGTVPMLPAPAANPSTSGFGRGIPYCPTDHLAYPAGAQFCPRCEGDLLVDCANCGTTIRAADPSCFHCGTHDTLARVSVDD
jgi:hypothetical protein